MIFVTADTDIGPIDMLRLAISCLTGIGALVLIAVLLFVVWLLVVLHQEKQKKPEPCLAEPIFTPEQATRYIQLKYRYETTEEVNR